MLKRSLLLIVFILSLISASFAQNPLLLDDLSKIAINKISPIQLKQSLLYYRSNGLSIGAYQAELALKGLNSAQWDSLNLKLKSWNLDKLLENDADSLILSSEAQSRYATFGEELFTTNLLQNNPLSLGAPNDQYVLGAGDALRINIYGAQEAQYTDSVGVDGYITIPYGGRIQLAGLSIEEAKDKISKILRTRGFATLDKVSSKISITLLSYKKIQVTVIGAIRSGNYQISAISSLFNVLSQAGGPSKFGSYRNIELIRNNQVVKKIDLYKLILYGSFEDNSLLKENDVIRVPYYKKRVLVLGQIKRKGFIELNELETGENILDVSGGLLEDAYSRNISIRRSNGVQYEIKSYNYEEFRKYKPQSGDLIYFGRATDLIENKVTITGAVKRPDVFEWKQGQKVSDIIKKADGLERGYNADRGLVLRLQNDQSKQYLRFNIIDSIGNIDNDLFLKAGDSIQIFAVTPIDDIAQVQIFGQIKYPGTYTYHKDIRIKDLILLAGGLNYAASLNNIEITRKKSPYDSLSTKSVTTLSYQYNQYDNSNDSLDLILQPWDIVSIKKMPDFKEFRNVEIEGEVTYPGTYTLLSEKERVSLVVKRSGNLTSNANIDAAYIKRKNNLLNEKEIIASINKINKLNSNDSSKNPLADSILYNRIPLDLRNAIDNPENFSDVILEDEDRIIIPRINNTIKVIGEVYNPVQLSYDAHWDLDDYINAAGGYTPNAKKSSAYVVYANGKSSTTKQFINIRSTPDIEPGAQVIVPSKKIDKKSESFYASMALIISSGVSVMYLLLNLVK